MEHAIFSLFQDIPPVTRCWLLVVCGLTLAEYCGVVSPYDLLYTFDLAFLKKEYWRIFASLFYFRPFGLDLVFTLYFVMKTSWSLEESINNTKAYLRLLFINVLIILGISAFRSPFYLLGPKLDLALLYIWSRRNSGLRVQILFLMEFSASYLPFVYALINVLLYEKPMEDIFFDIFAGQIYFFLEDVFPKVHGFYPISLPWNKRVYSL